MHAYGHQWACQLVYNPRIREGLGLSDGEGVERLWSRLRKLIGITRSSGVGFRLSMILELNTKQQRSRRLWLLDRQAACIGNELRDELGHWIQRRLRRGVEGQGNKAQETLADCGIPVQELRHQWVLQRGSQLSIRARESLVTIQAQ